MQERKMRIAIAGGGLGGLIAARAISEFVGLDKVELDVYEATTKMTEIGAGIVIWPRTWELLKRIGLEERLTKLLPAPPTSDPAIIFCFRKSDQEEGIDLHSMIMPGDIMRFHRAELQMAILESLKGRCRFHLSRRLESYHETMDCVEMKFEDGEVARCDFLIGADGIKSVVRRDFFAYPMTIQSLISVDPIWSGTVAYRGLIVTEELLERLPGHRASKQPMMYCGKAKHIVVYPVARDRLINVVAFVTTASEGTTWRGPATVDVTQDDFKSQFKGWEEEVGAIVDCIKEPKKWAIMALKPLDCYAQGRVALLGDAAHAMTPHLGSGAGQAIEDAFVLAQIMAENKHDLPRSIAQISRLYTHVRRPFGNRILRGSMKQGLLCEFIAPGFDDMKEGDTTVDVEKMRRLFHTVHKRWEWSWDLTVGQGSVGMVAAL